MRGLSYPILSVGFINSLFFGVFDQVLTNISPSSPPSYLHLFSAGCVAGAAQLVLAVPVDLVKIRLQAEQGDDYDGVTEEHDDDDDDDIYRKIHRPRALLENYLPRERVKRLL